jgi:hypothetical protein
MVVKQSQPLIGETCKPMDSLSKHKAMG